MLLILSCLTFRFSPQGARTRLTTSQCAQISKNNYCNESHLSLIARIADLSNTMAQHGQHRPQGPYLNNPGIFLPPGVTPT